MSILEKLYTHDSDQAIKDILRTYHSQKYCVVSFLYFANVMHHRLLEKPRTQIQQDYLHALKESDYVLPDGIALQLFYRVWSKGKRNGKNAKNEKTEKSLYNLNWTDFTPYLLSQLQRDKTKLILYGWTEEVASRTAKHFTDQWLTVAYRQNGFDKFDRSKLENLKDDNTENLVFLVARGTPRQEMWAQEHREKMHKYKLLVLLVGGLFDFLSGTERRSPVWMRKARVLETPWRIFINPTKNLRKLLRMFGIVRYRTKLILSWK